MKLENLNWENRVDKYLMKKYGGKVGKFEKI